MFYLLILIFLLKIHHIDSKIHHKTGALKNDNLSKTADEDDSCKQEEKIILQTIFTDYDKTIMPNKSGLEVQVEMHIQDISSLSELTSDFELDVLFSSIWRDPSLSFEQFKTCETNLTLDLGYLNRIWLPKVCVINSKQAEIHSSPSKNIMLTLYKNGTIWLNYRMKLRAPCAINLRTFPFDKQTCFLVIESYSYNNQRVKLEWLPSAPLTFIRPIELPDFSLTSFSTVKMTLEYPNGFWDQLNATFVFKRRYGFFVLQAYTPTYMTIFVSWISFFMDPRQISARATLGISAFLAMTFQFGTILKNQPPVSYVKSVDFWMLFSIFIMFATLAELAVISYMLKKSGASVGTTSSPSLDSPTANYVSKISALKYAISEAQLANNANCKRNGNIGRLINRSCPTFLQNDDCLFEDPKRCWSPDMVDKVALICLPAIFLSFNICYWAYHLFFIN